MKILGKKKIVEFIRKHPNSRSSLEAWVDIVQNAHWKTPAEVKQVFSSASFLSNNRVIFNISGNNFRLVAVVVYVQETMIISFLGTHAEYSKQNF